jgi:hypothetical protein
MTNARRSSLLLLILPVCQLAAPQVTPGNGEPMRQVLGPKVTKQIEGKFGQAPPSYQQLLKADSDIRKDHAVIVTQLMKQSTQLTEATAEIAALRKALEDPYAPRDMSRVAVLEQKIDVVIEATKQQKADHDAAWKTFWDWAKVIFVPIMAAASGAIAVLWKQRNQNVHLDAQDEAVDKVSVDLHKLEKNTDGLLKMAKQKAHDEGVVEGAADEQAANKSTVRGKLGRDV